MIRSSRFQEPPLPTEASHRLCGEPPDTEVFFNLPCAKKPMPMLDGDQNGKLASSVPGSGAASSEFNLRSHRRDLPLISAAKATWSPSGETAKLVIVLLSGASSDRVQSAVADGRLRTSE